MSGLKAITLFDQFSLLLLYIPAEELPDNWHEAADIQQLRSLDRSFVFPGANSS